MGPSRWHLNVWWPHMNDLRMVLCRHGRFFLPILVLALVVAIAGRVGSGQMVAQMHALGVMLLSFGASLYALDYLVRHVALCSERIFFLSPLPRWKMAGLHGCVLWSFLMVLYVVVSLSDSGRGETSWSAVLLGLIAKGVALACGMLMMLIGASAGKRVAGPGMARSVSWGMFVFMQILAFATLYFSLVRRFADRWVVGAVTGDDFSCYYLGMIPLQGQYVVDPEYRMLQLVCANGVLLALLVGVCLLIGRTRQNYLEK